MVGTEAAGDTWQEIPEMDSDSTVRPISRTESTTDALPQQRQHKPAPHNQPTTNHENVSAMNEHALVLEKQGRWDSAKEAFQDALRASPSDLRAMENYGNMLLRSGHVKQATHLLTLSLTVTLPHTRQKPCIRRQSRTMSS